MSAIDKMRSLLGGIVSGNDEDPENDNSNLTAVQRALLDESYRDSIKKQFEQGVIQYIKTQYDKRAKDRQPLDLKWRLNINYFNGDQFTYIDNVLGDIVETPLYAPWEERNVFNEVAPNLETRQAELIKRRNIMKNRPASPSSEDRTSAKIGNKVLASTEARLKMSDLKQEAILIATVMGTAIWKTTWDTAKGRVVGIDMRALDDKEEELLPIEQYEKDLLGESENVVARYIHEGDVNTTLHSPFEIYPENVNKPIRENRRVMHVVLMSPDEVFEKWGIIEEGKREKTYKIMSSDSRLYGGAVSGRASGKMFGITEIENCVKVYEEHELPSPRYPHGRLIICTDEHLLWYGPLPDVFGENDTFEFCFNIQQSLRTDGFFGKSIIERLIPVQNKYNALKNRKQDYLNRISIGVLLAEEGSLEDEDFVRAEGIAPGDIIKYRKGYDPPKFMTQDDLPQTVENEEANLLNSFNRLSGISQIAQQSVTPSNINSGLAISSLIEQDDTRIGLEAENIRNCLADVGRKWLILYHKHVKFPRMVRDIGKNEEFDIGEFIGDDLTSFDVFIETEPESADTLAQRKQKVIDLLNAGLFNDTETGNITNEGRIKIFEMLQMGNWEDFVSDDDVQQRRADRENNAMLIGKEPKIREFDDDVIHITKHNNFRLLAEYEEALERHPEIDQLFDKHVNDHLQNLAAKVQADQLAPGSDISAAMLPSGDEVDDTEQGDEDEVNQNLLIQNFADSAAQPQQEQPQGVPEQGGYYE